MTEERLQFDWRVASKGYRWISAASQGSPAKSPRQALVPVEPESAAESTAPSLPPEPALFRAFAEVMPDKEHILAFANRHGDLGTGGEFIPTKRADSPSGSPLQGTLLTVWQNQIADMQRLTGLWDLLQNEDRERLALYVRWKQAKDGMAVVFDSHPTAGKGTPPLGFHRARAVIASSDTRPELLETFPVDDPVLPGWVYLQREIDLHLHHVADEIPTRMVWNGKRNRPALGLVAPTLLAAVWLQFADAVSNDRTYSRCRECGKWFEVAPDAARTHRRFCSNGCRSKAYRQRQDRSRQLHAAGKPFEEIAQGLDADVAAVKRWITGVKE
jgi:hypothetical protein